MKITGVEAIELRLPEEMIEDKASAGQNSLVVKIYTDEGITGIGEVDSHANVAKAVIDGAFVHSVCTGLGQVLKGLDPLDIRVINEKLYQSTFYYGRRGVVVQAIGGIDIALWDLKGKSLGLPIYKLLGGPFQKNIRAYASDLFGRNGEETAQKAKYWKEQGYTAIKFGWGPMGQSEKLDLELVEGARKGAGHEIDIIVDAGCCWDTITAIKRARQFEDYNILWLEEPLQQDNIDGYKQLSNTSNIPIAAGEGESGRFAWRDLIERGGIHICQIDLARNGFTEGMRIADLAEDHSRKVVNHFYTSGINLAAGLHFLAARNSTFIFEYCVESTPIRWDLTKQKMNIDSDGYVQVPEGNGLGIDLDEDAIDTLRVK